MKSLAPTAADSAAIIKALDEHGTIQLKSRGGTVQIALTRKDGQRKKLMRPAAQRTNYGILGMYGALVSAAVLAAGCSSPQQDRPRVPLKATLMAATTAAAVEQKQPGPEIKVSAAAPQGFSLTADKGRTVYVEFLASKRLTDELRASMRAAGYKVTDDKDQASVQYELDGAFQALRPGTGRTAEVRAGEYAEDAKALKTKTGRGASVVVSFNPLMMLFGTIFSNVGDRAGARDAVNEGTTGDPDGKCLAKCEGWVYRQRAVLNLTRTADGATSRAAATSTLEAEQLAAADLLTKAASELNAVAGVPAMAFK